MRTLCLRWEHHDYLIHRSTWRFILVKTSIIIWAMKNPLLFRTYTTQLCGDCSKTLQGFLLNNYEGDPRSSTQGHRAPLPKDDFFPHRSYLQWEPWQTNRVRRSKFLKPFHNLVVGWFFIFFQRLFTLLLRMIVPTTRKPTRTGSAFVAPPLHQPGTQFCCALVVEWLTHNVPACGCLVWRRCDILIILCSELSTSSIIAPTTKSNHIQNMIGEVSSFSSLLFSVACTLGTKSNLQVEMEAELLGLNALLGALAAEADYVAAEQLLKDMAKCLVVGHFSGNGMLVEV